MTYFRGRSLWGQQSLRPEAAAFIARLPTPPSNARKIVINNLFKALVVAGVLPKLDLLQIYAADVQANALINWISGSFNASVVNSPTFTADRGFVGVSGTTSYLQSGYTPSSGPKWGQNDHSFGRWLRTGPGGGAMDMGAYETATLKSAYIQSYVGTNYIASDSGTQRTVSTDPLGSVTVNRSSSGSYDIYKDGAFSTNVTAASRAGSTLEMFVCAYNLDGAATTISANQVGAVWMGASLTSGEIAALHNAVDAYMTAVGA